MAQKLRLKWTISWRYMFQSNCCAKWTCVVVLGVVINIPLTDMMTRDGKSKTLSLDSLVSKLTGENKSIVLVIVEEFRKMKTEFLDTITERNQEVDSLKNDVKELRAKVSELEQCVDQADAYERLDTIIVSGGSVPAFTNGENCSTILKVLIKKKLHLEISSSDINTAHRLGKKTYFPSCRQQKPHCQTLSTGYQTCYHTSCP